MTDARNTSLAFVCVVAWLVAAASAEVLGIWSAIGGAAVLLGLAVLRFGQPSPGARLKPSVRLVLLGAALGGLMAVATHLAHPLVVRALPFVAQETERLYAAFRAPSLVVAAVGLVPVVAGEELVWRGLVQTALVRRFGAWRGVLLGALVYGLALLPLGLPLLAVVAFFCGLAWGALCALTGSLVPTLVAHLLWDVLVLLWLPLDTP
jgi:membrane protease YdiL (CAAX protease family)